MHKKLLLQITPYRIQLIRELKSLESRENQLENGFKSCQNWHKCQLNQKPKLYTNGKKADTKDIEDELVEWILMNRALGIAVTSWEVIIKACKLDESLKLKNINTLQNWCYRFLKRNMLTFRSGTHIGQKLPQSYPELMRKFTKFNEILRSDNDFELNQIANMDETPLFMNILIRRQLLKLVQKKSISKPMDKKKFT